MDMQTVTTQRCPTWVGERGKEELIIFPTQTWEVQQKG